MLNSQLKNSTTQRTPVLKFPSVSPRLQRFDYRTPLINQWHHLIAAIREKSSSKQWITLVNPPFIPNDQYLKEIGLGDHYIRIIQISEQNPSLKKYIRLCVQNGKSALVAIWSMQDEQLPEILQDNDALSCRTLLFSNAEESSSQLELAV